MSTASDPLQPPPTRLITGDELVVGTAATLRDFWAWALSDMRANTVRSMFAEFLVAWALGATRRPRIEWDAYDVVTPDGLTLEVKSGAYLQAWEQSRLSTVTFGGLRARTWTSKDGYSDTSSYNADGYVFAVLTATDHAGYDALDLSQWSFWVLPRQLLAATGQRSIRLSRVEELAAAPVGLADLAARVHEVVKPDDPVE